MRNPPFSRLTIFLFFAVFLASGASAPATVVNFNWPTSGLPWTAGTPSASGPGTTVSESFTSVNPNDITVTIHDSGMTYNNQTPAIVSNNFTGGLSGVNGINLIVSHSAALTSYSQVTVSFATPVINLSFQLWDIDAKSNQFADKISNIQALTDLGATVGADSITNVNPTYTSISGTGLSTVILGIADANDATNQGTINFVFNGPITQFSFQWSNNDPKLGQQGIALGPLTYTPVPESGSFLGVMTACLATIGFEFFRRRRQLGAATKGLTADCVDGHGLICERPWSSRAAPSWGDGRGTPHSRC